MGNRGGRGSVLAVTGQNYGPDGVFGTSDDLVTPLNSIPNWISVDATAGNVQTDDSDRVRGFNGFHSAGANFVLGDASVQFISEQIQLDIYRAMSTISGGEIVEIE